ncbi:hypothetical protein XENOCAPTIV_003371 [Xenoophorus captivus]|uniref:Uncharacterized protein n=1 Tax=Xenoophorus captivus TaxID=1517983 RepID=A0ABV0RQB0_9TELE
MKQTVIRVPFCLYWGGRFTKVRVPCAENEQFVRYVSEGGDIHRVVRGECGAQPPVVELDNHICTCSPSVPLVNSTESCCAYDQEKNCFMAKSQTFPCLFVFFVSNMEAQTE